MSSSRFSPASVNPRDVKQVQGCLLVSSLQPESIALILGCDDAEAKRFQDDARGALAEIKRRVAAARAT